MASLHPKQERQQPTGPENQASRESVGKGKHFSMAGRLALTLVAGLLIVLLATAAAIEPEERGYGTHQKLGFGECFVVAQWGVRCPSCGMTTSWARLLDGQIAGAVAANAGGVLLCLLAIVTAPWLLASSYLGRWWYLRPTASLVITSLAGVALVVVFDWIRHTGLALFMERIP